LLVRCLEELRSSKGLADLEDIADRLRNAAKPFPETWNSSAEYQQRGDKKYYEQDNRNNDRRHLYHLKNLRFFNAAEVTTSACMLNPPEQQLEYSWYDIPAV
jgi:hypothetical protein